MCVLLLLHLQTTFFFHCDTLLAVFRYFRGWFVRRMLEKSKAKVIINQMVFIRDFFFRVETSY